MRDRPRARPSWAPAVSRRPRQLRDRARSMRHYTGSIWASAPSPCRTASPREGCPVAAGRMPRGRGGRDTAHRVGLRAGDRLARAPAAGACDGEAVSARALPPGSVLRLVSWHAGGAGRRVFDEPAEGIHELHLLDGLTAGFQEARRADEDGEALGAGYGHVQPVAREEERQAARHVLPAGCRHREEDYGRLL